jgi:hypothetical protein
MAGHRQHPICKALRTAREVLDSAVLFLVFLALASLLIWHLYRFVASTVYGNAESANVPHSSSPRQQQAEPTSTRNRCVCSSVPPAESRQERVFGNASRWRCRHKPPPTHKSARAPTAVRSNCPPDPLLDEQRVRFPFQPSAPNPQKAFSARERVRLEGNVD